MGFVQQRSGLRGRHAHPGATLTPGGNPARLKAAVTAIKVGEATDPAVMIGPMVSQKQYDRVQGYIRLGVEEGAELLVGGEGRPEDLNRGWFVRPTVFTNVRNDMRIAREEIFGPVLCVIPYEDEAEAIAIANDTTYGLQAYVASANPEHARKGRGPTGIRPRRDQRRAA